MVDPESGPSAARRVEPGEAIYDEDGETLGRVRGLTDDRFDVEQVDESADGETERAGLPGRDVEGGFLVWRCRECGDVGDLYDGVPPACPNCDAPRAAIAVVREE